MSMDYGDKLKLIRKIEGFTQKEFSKLTGVSLSNIKNYETKQRKAKAPTVEKILKIKNFHKYSMWLMTNEIAPSVGQISPELKKEAVEEISSQQYNTIQSIMNSIATIDNDKLIQLDKSISQRGINFLLESLDPENQTILSLTGIKKQAAYQLKEMDDERVREILFEMDKTCLESRKTEKIKLIVKNAG